MRARFPQEHGSSEADEGTAAHWVAWELVMDREVALHAQAPNGLLVTEEMLEGADLIVDYLRMNGISPDSCAIEQIIPIASIRADMRGTPDLWSFDPVTCHLVIVDYKFGHRFVDEFWNKQGLCYLSGIVDKLQSRYHISWLEAHMTVAFTVIQPRCFYRGSSVRTHEFKLSDCRGQFNNLANMAEAATIHTPTATVNEHCGDCPGRHACDALQLSAYTAAEYSSRRGVVELTPSAAALELKILSAALDRLTARVEGLKEITIANLTAGKHVPYYRAEPGMGRSTWNIPAPQVIAIGSLSGVNLQKPPEVVTPTQAKKLGVNEQVVAQFSFTPKTATRLIPETQTDAARVFGRN
jgi:hypothetical protein